MKFKSIGFFTNLFLLLPIFFNGDLINIVTNSSCSCFVN